MQGHSAANIMPLAAANRIGTEVVTADEANGGQNSSLTFYGSSFITDETGEILAEMGRDDEGFITTEHNLDAIRDLRQSWGLFRDRRPQHYTPILGH